MRNFYMQMCEFLTCS